MKKFINILILLSFVNFMALPSIAVLLNFELPQTNVVISEEENPHGSSVPIFEKTIPKTLSVYDFLLFLNHDSSNEIVITKDDPHHLSPLLSVFSPPPEA